MLRHVDALRIFVQINVDIHEIDVLKYVFHIISYVSKIYINESNMHF